MLLDRSSNYPHFSREYAFHYREDYGDHDSDQHENEDPTNLGESDRVPVSTPVGPFFNWNLAGTGTLLVGVSKQYT